MQNPHLNFFLFIIFYYHEKKNNKINSQDNFRCKTG